MNKLRVSAIASIGHWFIPSQQAFDYGYTRTHSPGSCWGSFIFVRIGVFFLVGGPAFGSCIGKRKTGQALCKGFGPLTSPRTLTRFGSLDFCWLHSSTVRHAPCRQSSASCSATVFLQR